MNWLDILVVIILTVTLIRGCFKGLVQELASILSLVVGFFAANRYATDLQPLLESFISDPFYSQAGSYIIVFLLAFFAVLFASILLRKILAVSGLSGLDRFLGGGLGLVKGLLISCLILLLVTVFASPQATVLQTSRAAPYLQRCTEILVVYLPHDLRLGVVRKSQAIQEMWDTNWIEEKRRQKHKEVK